MLWRIMETKKCSRCGIVKSVSDYSKREKGHLVSRCKECVNICSREFYNKHKEEINQKHSSYYFSHKEESKAYHDKWRKLHPGYHAEKTRNWRLKNRESVRLHSRELYKQNREEIRKYHKEWREEHCDELKKRRLEKYKLNREKIILQRRERYYANRDHKIKYAKDWRANHPESVSASLSKYLQSHLKEHAKKQQRRRAVMRGSGGSFTIQEWVELCDFYDNKCLCCGKSDVKLTVDHIIPVKLGGRGSIDNIQPLCINCNSQKQAKYIDYRVNKLEMPIQERLF